jgi:NTP pyrophosphatase (non-canonical NTP hydrolase)
MLQEYAKLVQALKKPPQHVHAEMTPEKADLIHLVLGISGEAGELLDAIKKAAIYNRPLDLANVVEELGDLEFYLEALRQTLNLSREFIIQCNGKKLEARYKSGSYSDTQAQQRADKSQQTQINFGE